MLRAALVVTVALGVVGCKPAQTPRHFAHGAVLSLAMGIRTATSACVDKGEELYDAGNEAKALALVKRCSDAYNMGKAAVMAAASAVDAWGSVDNNARVACAVAEGAQALKYLVDTVKAAGVTKLPREIEDAASSAAWVSQFAGTECKVKP